MIKIQKKRRREARTDYLKRIKLLKSGSPRVVFRKTNNYVVAQYVLSSEAQDKVVFEVSSKSLLKFGWPKEAQGSLKSLTASYFVGLVMAKEVESKKLDKPIVDFGMIKTLHKTRVFAFLKGLIDGGLEISCKEEALPSEDRISGQHLKNKIKFEEIKSNIEKGK